LITDPVPAGLADGLAPRPRASAVICRYDCGRFPGQSIRPRRVGRRVTRLWVPRSPPHRAGATRQVEYDLA